MPPESDPWSWEVWCTLERFLKEFVCLNVGRAWSMYISIVHYRVLLKVQTQVRP